MQSNELRLANSNPFSSPPPLFTFCRALHGKYKEGRQCQIRIWQIEIEIEMKETLGVVKNPVASPAAENRAAARKAVAVVDRKAADHKVEVVAVPAVAVRAVAIGKLGIGRASCARPSLSRFS